MKRAILIAALVFSAATHAYLAPEHLREMPVVGVLFTAAALAAAILAVALLARWTSVLVPQAAVALLALLLIAYVPFVAVHVPFAAETPEPIDAIAVICKVAELVGLVAAIAVIRSGSPRPRRSIVFLTAALAGAAGLVVPAALGATGISATVTMQVSQFMPGEAVALSSEEVVWRNDDDRSHTVTADDGSFDSGPIAPGGVYSLPLKPGSYRYHCTIHRFMRGIVDVYDIAFNGPRRVAVDSTATYTGRAPSGARTVVIEHLSAGQWETLAGVTSATDGTFAWSMHAAHETLRARVEDQTSRTIETRVSPHLSLSRGARSIQIVATPAQPGGGVALERYDRFHFAWTVVERARLDAESRVTIRFRPRGTREYVRAELVRPKRGYATATSHPLIVSRVSP